MNAVRIILAQIFTAFNPGNLLLMLKTYSGVFVVLAGGYIIHFLPVKVKESYRGMFIRIPLAIQVVLVYIVALALYNIQSTDFQPFIYFRF